MPTVKPLDHDTATDKQKRTHYSSGCRDQACKDAVAAYQREAAARRKAAKLAAATTTEPSGGEENVEPPVSTPTSGTVPTDSAPVPASSPEPTFPAGRMSSAPTPDADRSAKPHPALPATAGRTSSRGATRRLQALVWLGYTPVELARATQISVDNIWWLLFCPPATVQDVTHRIIVTHYNRMKIMSPELPDVDVARCKNLAGDHGWAGPFDWDNVDTDQKAAHGTRRPTRAEVLQERVIELEKELAKKLEYSAPPAAVDFDTRAELTKVQRELTGALEKVAEHQAALESEQASHATTKTTLGETEAELLALGTRYQELSAEGESLAALGNQLVEEVAEVAQSVGNPQDDGLRVTGIVAGHRVEIPVVLRVSIALGE